MCKHQHLLSMHLREQSEQEDMEDFEAPRQEPKKRPHKKLEEVYEKEKEEPEKNDLLERWKYLKNKSEDMWNFFKYKPHDKASLEKIQGNLEKMEELISNIHIPSTVALGKAKGPQSKSKKAKNFIHNKIKKGKGKIGRPKKPPVIADPQKVLIGPNFCCTLKHILHDLPLCSRPITNPIKSVGLAYNCIKVV